MKRIQLNSFWLAVLSAVIIFGCTPDDPEPDEEEVITTLTLTFTDANTNNVTTASFKDPDGAGGNPPTQIDTIRLDANSTYAVSITLLNESESPVEDITAEVRAEDDEHLFCFFPASGNLTISRTDSDGTYEVGLESEWTTGSASDGTVVVVLKHQPDVKDGSCDPGETDIEVSFHVVVS